jgi:hypothetical protein
MAAWAIVGPRHVGITISDLDRSLAFCEGVLWPAGGKSLYSLDPASYIVELHERPPG